MQEICIVIGQTGEYSDKSHWYVAAYINHKSAEELKRAAQRYIDKAPRKVMDSWTLREEHAKANPFDPQCNIDYTSTTYSILKLPIKDWALFKEAQADV